MVEVRDVRVSVDHGGVLVLVGVSAGEPVGVLMIVMSVVVGVIVFVQETDVAVLM